MTLFNVIYPNIHFNLYKFYFYYFFILINNFLTLFIYIIKKGKNYIKPGRTKKPDPVNPSGSTLTCNTSKKDQQSGFNPN